MIKLTIGVINYGVGNLGSIISALNELNSSAVLVDQPNKLKGINALILPGVGGFTECMGLLSAGGWFDAIREEAISSQKPLLGICLGMQLLATAGDEGALTGRPTNGLGLIPGKVVALNSLGCRERLPHVGWNDITVTRDSQLMNGIPTGTDFYFVHSYAFTPEDPADILATADYGVGFVAAIGRANIWGTQFHPEKSSRAGFQVLKNFLEVI